MSDSMRIEKFVGGSYQTIGYLIVDKGDAMLIDAPEHTAVKIEDYIKKNELKLKIIIATHVHWDHTADAEKLSKLAHAKLAMHKMDEQNQSEINSIFEGVACLATSPDKWSRRSKSFHASGHWRFNIKFYAVPKAQRKGFFVVKSAVHPEGDGPEATEVR